MFAAGDHKLSPEEVVGMSLHYMVEMTKAYGKHKEVASCVIAVPPHFTEQARAALITAADIAGLRVLSIVNDNAAVALRYGQERAANAKDETVLFIDVGASFTSASVATYSTKKGVPQVQVKAVAWDAELGGRHFDVRLAEYLADEFDKKTGFKIRENLKSYTKLLTAASKAKMQLSANEMTVVSIGSLMNDVDFQLKVERKKLDELCNDLYGKIAVPVKKVLAETKLEVSALDHVVPFGGGWRVPGLQNVLKEELSINKLETILNSDEAAAFGAVFMHGNSSGLLRVRNIVLQDLTTPPKAASAPEPLRGAAMGAAKNRHSAMCDAEEARRKKEGAKSSLEAWIYSVKEKTMEEEMEAVATEDDVAEVKAALEAGEEWIYDEGENAELAAYEAKKAEIEKKVATVIERYDEYLARPAAVEKAEAAVAKALSNAEDWAKSRPQIPASELAKLKKQADDLSTLLRSKVKLVGDGLKGPLPFRAAELLKKAGEVKDLMEALLLIRPKAEL
jgi:molecular chaperone DnaK (HSP70)